MGIKAPRRSSRMFGGINSSFEEAKFVIIPVPYDSSTTWLPGARFGPSEVIDASRYLEPYDIELGAAFGNIWTMEEIEPVRASAKKTIGRVKGAVEWVLSEKKFPILLGGDHSITVGSVKAFKQRYEDLLCLFFDAHADLYDEYEGSKYSHACTARRCYELGAKIVAFGVRSLGAEEVDFVGKKEDISIVSALEARSHPEEALSKALSRFPELPVYLSFDVDFLDPSIMPCTGTPEPGGFDWYTTTRLLKKVISSRRIVGMDFVEFSPVVNRKDAAYLLAKLIYKSIGYLTLFQI
ncbi:MAG: agmatinase [Thermoproteota archaeon]|nr:MAG: agmatinase [Candidatus Korarchaeota archaeon]